MSHGVGKYKDRASQGTIFGGFYALISLPILKCDLNQTPNVLNTSTEEMLRWMFEVDRIDRRDNALANTSKPSKRTPLDPRIFQRRYQNDASAVLATLTSLCKIVRKGTTMRERKKCDMNHKKQIAKIHDSYLSGKICMSFSSTAARAFAPIPSVLTNHWEDTRGSITSPPL